MKLRAATGVFWCWAVAITGSTGAIGCGDPPLAAAAAVHDTGADFAQSGLDASQADGQAATDAKYADGPTSGDVQVGLDDASDVATTADGTGDAPAGADGGGGDVALAADGGMQDFVFTGSNPPVGSAALPAMFSIKLTFSANLKPASATKTTITVTTNGGVALPCKFAVTADVLTITPIAPAPFASRVTVALGTLVQSFQGVPLQQTQLAWYTQNWPDQTAYAQWAEIMAPTVRQNIGGPTDYLRSADLDGDWNWANNVTNAASTPLLATISWSAIETRSHLYLTYVYFWPARSGIAPGVPLDNDVAGAQVVVERKSGLPVAIQSFFKAKVDEQAWLWIAAESGWPTKSIFIRAVVPRDQLFGPSDASGCSAVPPALTCKRRYPAYLTAGSHQSCLWLDKGEVADQQCVVNDLIKANLALVVYGPAVKATAPAAPTASESAASYALAPLLDSWWPHRDEAGPTALFDDTQFVYVPPAGRPAGPAYGLGSKNLTAQQGDFARPPWAWRWKPATLAASYYDLPRGTAFFDPAWQLWQRLGGETTAVAPYNDSTKQGFSTDYCFNPYLGIDVRATAACQP